MLVKQANNAEPENRPGQEGVGISRRQLLAGAAGLAGVAGLAAITSAGSVLAQDNTGQDTSRVMGAPADELGERSTHEQLVRMPVGAYPQGTIASFTPLADLDGIITPSDLH
jgi:hypothetical protein